MSRAVHPVGDVLSIGTYGAGTWGEGQRDMVAARLANLEYGAIAVSVAAMPVVVNPVMLVWVVHRHPDEGRRVPLVSQAEAAHRLNVSGQAISPPAPHPADSDEGGH